MPDKSKYEVIPEPLRRLTQVSRPRIVEKETGVSRWIIYNHAAGKQKTLRSDHADALRKFFKDLVEKL